MRLKWYRLRFSFSFAIMAIASCLFIRLHLLYVIIWLRLIFYMHVCGQVNTKKKKQNITYEHGKLHPKTYTQYNTIRERNERNRQCLQRICFSFFLFCS